MKNNLPALEEICSVAGRHPKMAKGCYIFGSQVYGTASETSDWDVILIANANAPEVEYKSDKINVHVIVPDLADKYLRDNHIKAIECLCAPDWAIILPYYKWDEFVYKEDSFRHNISHTVSNSWVKCKKKMEQGDYYIGVKSMFHSLRIADFGVQFATERKIDFERTNDIWEYISSKEWTWEELKDRYQPTRNRILTTFRAVTSK